MINELAEAWVLEPDQILTREAMSEARRTCVCPEEQENEEIRILALVPKEGLRKDFAVC